MKKSVLLFALSGLAAASGYGAGPGAAPAAGGARVFPAWARMGGDADARALIRSLDGTPPVSCPAPGTALLPVSFSSRKPGVSRANWDIAIPCDLRLARGVQFDFYCGDFSPFLNFSFYFKSGNGWYHGRFSPALAGVWQRIVVSKAETIVEGNPAGWGDVSAFRVSGWRCGGGDAETRCAIANLAPAGGRPVAIVLRADSRIPEAGGEARSLQTYAETVSATLDALGIEAAQMADTDLAPEMLEGVGLAVLPYNPGIPKRTADCLAAFVARGGKLLVCYSLPKEAAEMLGIRRAGFRRAPGPAGAAFSGFSRAGAGLPGQPAFAAQASWATTLADQGRDGRIVAVWRGGDGKDTGLPAAVVTGRGAFFGHVWLGGTGGAQAELMRSVVGALVPRVWEDAARGAHVGIGRTVCSPDADALRKQMPAVLPPDAARVWGRMEAARASAAERLKAGAWRESIRDSSEAARLAVRAWMMSRPPKTGEHRAFWCHSAWGLGGTNDWDSSIRFLKESGFNAILPNFCWGGVAFYPSSVLPVSPAVAERGDPLAACLAACRKYGVKCHVWKVCWNMGGHTPEAFREKMRAAGRTQKRADGTEEARWLCPSNPDNQRMEIDAMTELARMPVDGIHFDYIRYGGEDVCFCDGCRARFEKKLGRKVADWPGECLREGGTRDAWQAFRRENITKVVREVAGRVRRGKRRVELSAAVFRGPESDRETVAQDWAAWCREGLLDFVCPMDYVDSPALFRNMAESQKRAAGKARLYPGIGLSCWRDPRDPVNLALQIQEARDAGLPGFTVFNFDRCAEAVLPVLRLGPTRE